jgi:hypothetical protein
VDDARVVARIPKSDRFELRVQLGTYKGKPIIDVREWWLHKESGEWRPGNRGLATNQKFAPQLAEALVAAVEAIKSGQATPAASKAGEER